MSAKFIWPLLLIVLFALLQNTNLLNFYGVKPNLVLVFLISLSFFVSDLFIYLYFILAGMIFLGFQPVIALLAAAAFLIGPRLHGQPYFNNLFLVVLGTVIFHLLAGFVGWPVVLKEVVYNLVVGLTLFGLLEKIIGHEKKSIFRDRTQF